MASSKFKFKIKTIDRPSSLETGIGSVNLSDSDDDDFKPLPVRKTKIPVPTATVAGEELPLRSSDDGFKFGEAIKADSCYAECGGGTTSNLTSEHEAIKEDIEDDDVTFLHAENGQPVKSCGQSAWKDLMDQMQQNQKGKGKAGPSKAISKAKKNKTIAKRSLMQSPKSKGRKSSTWPSPLKKNPRLGSPLASSSVAGQMKEENRTVPAPVLDSIIEESTVRKALSVANLSSSFRVTPANNSIKVAPIFLPASERKELCLSKSATSNGTEALSSLIKSTSQYDTSVSNFPENPDHFEGNRVILNQDAITEDPWNGTKTKVCPFYKKLLDLPFCVDAFNYGLIPKMEVYFLSHFHSDHYIGLTKKFCKTLICSFPTGNLVRMKLYVDEKYIRKLNMNKPYIIYDTEVTLVDANHCPGSVMFIFRLKNNRVILHTGDFRFTKDMMDSPLLSQLKVNDLYLDTTYCSPEYDFPTQCESISNVITQIQRRLESRPKTIIVCGSYLIGKERVYFTLAEAIGSKVFANYDKRRTLNALENPKYSSMLTANEHSYNSKVHVVPMFSITAKNLQEYLANHPQYTHIIGVKPSGWQFSAAGTGCSIRTYYNDTVTMLGVPYSEHSSFSELKEFVARLKPNRIQPTVNVGNGKKREEMMRHINAWLSA